MRKDVYLCFINYETSFDTVRHQEMLRMLARLVVGGKSGRSTRGRAADWHLCGRTLSYINMVRRQRTCRMWEPGGLAVIEQIRTGLNKRLLHSKLPVAVSISNN